MNRLIMALVGLVIIAIGAALVAGIFTQTTVTENKETKVVPGVIPIVLPSDVMGFPTFGIGAVIALIGVAVVFIGFKFGY